MEKEEWQKLTSRLPRMLACDLEHPWQKPWNAPVAFLVGPLSFDSVVSKGHAIAYQVSATEILKPQQAAVPVAGVGVHRDDIASCSSVTSPSSVLVKLNSLHSFADLSKKVTVYGTPTL